MNEAPRPISTPRLPLPGPVLILLSWLVPGLGFMLCGRKSRGLAVFVLIMVTFLLGLVAHGGVVWPTWSTSDESFNLMNNLIFLVQMLAGAPALVSLAASRMEIGFLGGAPEHAFFELGSYYLVVAGALNYFAATNFHDRIVRTSLKYRAQELGLSEEPTPASVEPPSQAGAA